MLRSRFLPALVVLVALSSSFEAEAARRRAIDHPGIPLADIFSQGGYASRPSVVQGGTITFHIASDTPRLAIDIVNLAHPEFSLKTINVSSHPQPCDGKAGSDCGWDATTTLFIPETWQSGYYAARFPTTFGERWAPFVVVSQQPGITTKMLVVSSTHTMQAYNRFGSVGDAERVSYRRPYATHDGLGIYPEQEALFAEWLTNEGLSFDVATDADLEDPELLPHYNLVVFAGRSEFWTANARHNVEAFNTHGGHVVVLNGNTMLRTVHLEDTNETIVGANVSNQETAGRLPQLTSTRWFEAPTVDPETRLFGSSLRYGGIADLEAGSNGWTAVATSHWIYGGTNVEKNSLFGAETLGGEVGGTLLNCGVDGGMIGIDAAAGTPPNYLILAWTPASEGTGTMGIYTNTSGGAIFNAGTERWVDGLREDPIVQRMTSNLINQFVSGEPVPYQAQAAMLLTEERFNCRQYTMHNLPGWTQSPTPAVATKRCAYEGPAGGEFSGAEGIQIVRDFTPTENLQEMGARFYINADAYLGKPDRPLLRVTLRKGPEQDSQEPLVVEINNIGGSAQTRLIRRDSAGNAIAGDWLTLGGPGWHLFWLTWRSPGQIVLQLDKIPTRTLDNPDTTQFVGEIAFEYPQPASDDDSFVCMDGLAIGHVKPGSLPPNP